MVRGLREVGGWERRNGVNHIKKQVHVQCVGREVTLWLVRWTLDQAIQVHVSAGALRCVLSQEALHLQCLSSPRYINGNWRIYCWG